MTKAEIAAHNDAVHNQNLLDLHKSRLEWEKAMFELKHKYESYDMMSHLTAAYHEVEVEFDAN